MTTAPPILSSTHRSLPELRAKLIQMLTQEGRVEKSLLQDIQQRAAWKEEPVERVLARENVLPEEEVLQHLSALSGIPLLKSYHVTIDPAVVAAVPPRAVVRYRIMPLYQERGHWVLATDHVRDTEEEAQLRVVLGRPLAWVLCTAREVSEFITHYYGIGIEQFLDLEEQDGRGASVSRRDSEEPLGIPAFVDEIVRDAIRSNATDIHLEPEEDGLRVRYRIDGVLYPARLPKGIERYQRAIISSVKVMAQLDIAERRLPQDGRLEKDLDDQSFDIRVSVLPSRHGEAVALRLLNRSATFLRMDELGLPNQQREQLEDLIRLPHGLLLFTGPTGSGKTTSLYAALARLNNQERKIVTVEDPVEYQIRGITQLQVQATIGFTFASGLRSILRHDPDVILVGEIRDDETADIAVSAALTGHLVLSTLHTNDSAGAATRLVDMGIEPYLVASSLEGIIAQRLIRRICPHCREEMALEEPYEEEVCQLFPEATPPFTIWRGRGCPFCRFTGYLGRKALYEILDIDEEMRGLIVERAPSGVIMQRAMANGLTPLRGTGWNMVLNGETTLEDLLRVTRRDKRQRIGRG